MHRHIGMGGDQLVAAFCDDEVEARHGDSIRSAESEFYGELIDEVEPLPGAIDLIAKLKENGRTVVLASSAKEPEVEHYVDLLAARELADGWTSAADVERTEPAPNLILAALECAHADPEEAVMVGDSTWDCEAAQRAGVEVIGLSAVASARGSYWAPAPPPSSRDRRNSARRSRTQATAFSCSPASPRYACVGYQVSTNRRPRSLSRGSEAAAPSVALISARVCAGSITSSISNS